MTGFQDVGFEIERILNKQIFSWDFSVTGEEHRKIFVDEFKNDAVVIGIRFFAVVDEIYFLYRRGENFDISVADENFIALF